MSEVHAAHDYSPCRGSMHTMQDCMLMSPTALQMACIAVTGWINNTSLYVQMRR